MKNFFAAFIFLIVFNLLNAQNTEQRRQIAELNAKISKSPDNINYYFERGVIYDELNDFASSNRDFMKVLELYQKNPEKKYRENYIKAAYHLADDNFFRNSKNEQALKYVQEGLKEHPGNKDLEIIEAIILASDPEDYNAAFDKFEALEKRYESDVRLNLYFARFLENDDPLAAAELYERVVAADPQNEDAFVSLGTIYNNEASRLSEEGADPGKVMDYLKKAEENFAKAGQLNPDDPEVQQILQTLEKEGKPIKEELKRRRKPVRAPY